MKARAGGAQRIWVPSDTSKCHENGAYLWPGLYAWPWCLCGSKHVSLCFTFVSVGTSCHT